MKRLRVVGVVLCATVFGLGCKSTSDIDDLGSLGGRSGALGINKVGNVTGFSYLSPDAHFGGMHAFRYVDGLGMLDAGALPGSNISEGSGINSGGLIVGGSLSPADSVGRAIIISATLNVSDLGTLGGDYSYAWDINDHGQVTGEASTRQQGTHAFIWTSAGGMKDIGTLGGNSSVGHSINESGQVAGTSATKGSRAAFRYTEGVGMINLGTLGGRNSSGHGINDRGQVVGASDADLLLSPNVAFRGIGLLGSHAFLWTEGAGMIDLGHLGGGRSSATAINNGEVVVGYSTLADGTTCAFRWTRQKGMINLNTLLPDDSDWILLNAWDINDKGQIVGEGIHKGRAHAYRLQPEPLPLIEP